MSDVRTARTLISVVELVGVRLIELHASTQLSGSEIPPVTIEHTYKASASGGEEAGNFIVLASIDVRINATEGEKQPLVRVRGKLELRYKVPSDYVVARKELGAFARVNAIYNAWPYFREMVQSVTGRMDLPPVILPVYRIPRPQPPRRQAARSAVTRKATEIPDSKVAPNVTN